MYGPQEKSMTEFHTHEHDQDEEYEDFDPIPVSEVMTADVVCATSDTSLQEIARTMLESDCGAIPIVDSQDTLRPIGIITDRDITIRAVAEGRNPLELTAADCLTQPVLTISPDSDLEECLDLMEENQLRRVIVVNDEGAIVGIIAQADIAQWASDQEAAELLQEVSEPDEEENR
jgi:CBS domain-containing protein